MKSQTKKVIAGLGVAGAMVTGGSVDVFPVENQMNPQEYFNYQAIVDREVSANGGIIANGNVTISDINEIVIDRIKNRVETESVVIGDNEYTAEEYNSLKNELQTKAETKAESLLDRLID